MPSPTGKTPDKKVSPRKKASLFDAFKKMAKDVVGHVGNNTPGDFQKNK
jgi:hypothetical protein